MRGAEKERQKKIQEIEKHIDKLKEILESPVETEDQEKLDAELVSIVLIVCDQLPRTPAE